MSTIKTQAQALAEIHRLSDLVTKLVTRFENGGAAVKADAAGRLATIYREVSAVFGAVPTLYSGRGAARYLAISAARDAATLNLMRAEEWSRLAAYYQAEAQRIARAGEAAFAELAQESRRDTAYPPARRLRSVKP
jgi:hypothetical protein